MAHLLGSASSVEGGRRRDSGRHQREEASTAGQSIRRGGEAVGHEQRRLHRVGRSLGDLQRAGGGVVEAP
jgi:hypothetical protein